jgi:hypothetical protein
MIEIPLYYIAATMMFTLMMRIDTFDEKIGALISKFILFIISTLLLSHAIFLGLDIYLDQLKHAGFLK